GAGLSSSSPRRWAPRIWSRRETSDQIRPAASTARLTARKTSKSRCMAAALLGGLRAEDAPLEHLGRPRQARRRQPLQVVRADAGGVEVALGAALAVHPRLLEQEQVVGAQVLPLHADHPARLQKALPGCTINR